MTGRDEGQDIGADFGFRKCFTRLGVGSPSKNVRMSRGAPSGSLAMRSRRVEIIESIADSKRRNIGRNFQRPGRGKNSRNAEHIERVDPPDRLKIALHRQADIFCVTPEAVPKKSFVPAPPR